MCPDTLPFPATGVIIDIVTTRETMQRPCFIYAITHASAKRYVGSTINLKYRWWKHKRELLCGRHHCIPLQVAWTKYGADAFTFSVLSELPTNNRATRAAAELKEIDALPCYNLRTAKTNLQNFENSPSTRKRISKGLNAAMANPEVAARYQALGRAIAAMVQSPEGRERAKQNAKRRWQDPVERQKLSRGHVNRWAQPDSRERQSAALRQARGTPEARKHNSDMTAAAWRDPSSGLRNRKQTRWADPEAKARQAEKMRAYHASKRTT